MKACTKCREVKPLSAFYRNASHEDGLTSACKLCEIERHREYREANRDRLAEQKREYREANRDRLAEQDREYYEANRDRIVERQCEYHEYISTQINRIRRRDNVTSIRNATHHHQPWSATEDLIAERADLSTKEVAFMLGRSIRSVTSRRFKLRSRATSTAETKAGAA